MKRNIILLGSSGSIGKNVIKLYKYHKDKFKISALIVNRNISLLEEQIRIVNPEIVAIVNEKAGKEFLSSTKFKGEIFIGKDAIIKILRSSNANTVINSIVGEIGLIPTYEALLNNKQVLLANKESLIVGGDILNKLSKEKKLPIIPIDSEHSAIFQCLEGHKNNLVEKIILTASGGPFFKLGMKHFKNITPDKALRHPKWKMGKKITIDSATMMNKGLEVIEAHWLFDIDYDKIDVVIHPQSIVHSIVEFIDGSFIAQMGITDMIIPISYAISYPERFKLDKKYHISFPEIKKLTFYSANMKKFPCLKLAYEAGRSGGNATIILNSANEEAVDLFLNRNINFLDIHLLIKKALDKFYDSGSIKDIHSIFPLIKRVRNYIKKQVL